MPLKFTLRPGEKVIVNGAVIGRGEEPGSFYLFNKANFLRGREVMKEEQADTLEKKLYLVIQLIYLFPENAPENLVKFETILAETMRSPVPRVCERAGRCGTARAYRRLLPCTEDHSQAVLDDDSRRTAIARSDVVARRRA